MAGIDDERKPGQGPPEWVPLPLWPWEPLLPPLPPLPEEEAFDEAGARRRRARVAPREERSGFSADTSDGSPHTQRAPFDFRPESEPPILAPGPKADLSIEEIVVALCGASPGVGPGATGRAWPAYAGPRGKPTATLGVGAGSFDIGAMALDSHVLFVNAAIDRFLQSLTLDEIAKTDPAALYRLFLLQFPEAGVTTWGELDDLCEMETRLKALIALMNRAAPNAAVAPPERLIVPADRLDVPRRERARVYSDADPERNRERGFLQLPVPGGGVSTDPGEQAPGVSPLSNSNPSTRVGDAAGVVVSTRPSAPALPRPADSHVHIHPDTGSSSHPSIDDVLQAVIHSNWDDPSTFLIGAGDRFYVVRRSRNAAPGSRAPAIFQGVVPILREKTRFYQENFSTQGAWLFLLDVLRQLGVGVYAQDNVEWARNPRNSPETFSRWDASNARIFR
jgi:hypothetical protein